MSKPIKLFQNAPDFELHDYTGKTIRLSDFRGKKHIFLVFNRGFM